MGFAIVASAPIQRSLCGTDVVLSEVERLYASNKSGYVVDCSPGLEHLPRIHAQPTAASLQTVNGGFHRRRIGIPVVTQIRVTADALKGGGIADPFLSQLPRAGVQVPLLTDEPFELDEQRSRSGS
jgi:hypothetical protein